MNSEMLLRLKETGRMMKGALMNTAPVDVDIVHLVTRIDDFRGKTVRVQGEVAEHFEEKVVPKISSKNNPSVPVLSDTITSHKVVTPGRGEIGTRFGIVFQEIIEHDSGRSPQQPPRHEGWVTVTGRVAMERVQEGTIKTVRPYLQYPQIKPL